MRIIAGTLKARQFDSPRSPRTHPMSEKVRGALFNMLGDMSGLTVLDAFGGSGALAFEALSRGAASATIVESDAQAHKVITRNLQALGLRNQCKAVHSTVQAWLSTQPTARADIIICDPPYDQPQLTVISQLAERLADSGILVLSMPPSINQPLEAKAFEQLALKTYGDASLTFFRRLR